MPKELERAYYKYPCAGLALLGFAKGLAASVLHLGEELSASLSMLKHFLLLPKGSSDKEKDLGETSANNT